LDLGGQDSFKYALSSFFRNANGIVICFDITNLESFHNVNNWLENVQRLCPEQTPIFLVGTKSDLKLRRKISHEMIEAYAEKNNLSYIETSSKTNENVEKCFVDFTRILMAHIHQIDGSTIDLNNRQESVTNLGTSGC
jgi:small GTP-binding protein